MPNQVEEQAEEVIGNSSKPSTHKSANDVTHQKQEQEQKVEGSRDFGACGSRSWRYNSLFFCVIFLHLKFRPTSKIFHPSPLTTSHQTAPSETTGLGWHPRPKACHCRPHQTSKAEATARHHGRVRRPDHRPRPALSAPPNPPLRRSHRTLFP